jgi:hypothetical protein
MGCFLLKKIETQDWRHSSQQYADATDMKKALAFTAECILHLLTKDRP